MSIWSLNEESLKADLSIDTLVAPWPYTSIELHCKVLDKLNSLEQLLAKKAPRSIHHKLVLEIIDRIQNSGYSLSEQSIKYLNYINDKYQSR